MDFKSYLQRTAQQIDEQLDLVLSQFLTEVKSKSPKLIPFALGFISSCKGGKRIRGVLVKLGYEIATSASRRTRNDVIRIGAALEILHTAILIHDDIIDQSPSRRGQPSLYKLLGGGHKGESLAICLGDVGLYLPIQIIAEANFLSEYKIKAFAHLSQIIVNTAWGQVLEIETQSSANLADINLIQRLKTAYYTVCGPLILGAILAGAREEQLGLLGLFGENLGIAYQIQDDILDNEVDYIGGEVNAKKEALKNIADAKKIIPELTKDKKMSTLLEQMADYLVQRSK